MPDGPALADCAQTVWLVLTPHGRLSGAFTPEQLDDARAHARAVGGLIAAAPVVEDHRG